VIGAQVAAPSEPARAAMRGGARHAPVGLRFKLLYGSGALVDGIITAALTYFLLFYLTAVCGLSGSFAGSALLIGLLMDALVEPAVGLLSDNTRSRMGRRLPYLLYGTLPVAILFALLFSIPSSLGHAPLLVYATFCSMAVRIGQSVFNIPYVAVGAEVTDDYAERSSITSYRVCFSMLGIFLTIGLGLGLFMSGPSGLLNRGAYVPFGWTCAALIAAGGFCGALATRGVLPRLHVSDRAHGPVLTTFLFEIRDILRNR
jgi:GPH family glycoside/pentoside/hexuronide:cation symporter